MHRHSIHLLMQVAMCSLHDLPHIAVYVQLPCIHFSFVLIFHYFSGPCIAGVDSCVNGICSCNSGYEGSNCCSCQEGFSKTENGTCEGMILLLYIHGVVQSAIDSIHDIFQRKIYDCLSGW